MSHTLTIRLTDELLDWLKETSLQTGIPVGRIVREQLETARAREGKQRFLRHAGQSTGRLIFLSEKDTRASEEDCGYRVYCRVRRSQ